MASEAPKSSTPRAAFVEDYNSEDEKSASQFGARSPDQHPESSVTPRIKPLLKRVNSSRRTGFLNEDLCLDTPSYASDSHVDSEKTDRYPGAVVAPGKNSRSSKEYRERIYRALVASVPGKYGEVADRSSVGSNTSATTLVGDDDLDIIYNTMQVPKVQQAREIQPIPKVHTASSVFAASFEGFVDHVAVNSFDKPAEIIAKTVATAFASDPEVQEAIRRIILDRDRSEYINSIANLLQFLEQRIPPTRQAELGPISGSLSGETGRVKLSELLCHNVRLFQAANLASIGVSTLKNMLPQLNVPRNDSKRWQALQEGRYGNQSERELHEFEANDTTRQSDDARGMSAPYISPQTGRKASEPAINEPLEIGDNKWGTDVSAWDVEEPITPRPKVVSDSSTLYAEPMDKVAPLKDHSVERNTESFDGSGASKNGADSIIPVVPTNIQRESLRSDLMAEAIEAVRVLASCGDSTKRFKEELHDIVSPFQNKQMWNPDNILWDDDQPVILVPSVSMFPSRAVPRDGLDVVNTRYPKSRKSGAILNCLSHRKIASKSSRFGTPSEGKVRIVWPCNCPDRDIYVDVAPDAARRFRMTCSTSKPILPTNNSTTQDNESTLFEWGSALFSTYTNQIRQRLSPSKGDDIKRTDSKSILTDSSETSEPSSLVPLPKNMHFCVDASIDRTLMRHICIEEKKGKEFFQYLKSLYREIRGWKWYLSFKTCQQIKLVKLIRVLDNEDIVYCHVTSKPQDRLPDLADLNRKYDYQRSKPPGLSEEEHLIWAERALTEYYHGHPNCQTPETVRKLLYSVPHRHRGDKLEPHQQAIGYGTYAVLKWDWVRVVAAFVLLEMPLLVFAGWWLNVHHGDLQNAVVPLLVVAGVMAMVVGLVDHTRR